MYDEILVPTDGSDVAERAGSVAIEMATRFDARLSVISVIDPDDDVPAQEAIDAIADAASAAGLDSETDIVDNGGEIHRSIIDYGTEHDVDAIVMGTHGRTGVNRFLLGSVAEQTLRESSIPVVTVHEGTETAFELEDVLVPTDGSEGAEAALDHAFDLVTETKATLHVLHVTGRRREAEDTPLDAASERATAAGIEDVVTATRSGNTHEGIAGYVTEAGIDCVVMGSHGRTGLRRYLLGSVTERTVRFAPVPVISVKPPRVTATVEFLDYEVIADQGWSLADDDLFEKAAGVDLAAEAYGTLDVDQGEYVLEAAEAAGHDWPFHCRGGACVNCAAVLVEGDLEMEVARSLSEEEIDEQNIRLTCVATPTTDRVRLVYNANSLDTLRDRVI